MTVLLAAAIVLAALAAVLAPLLRARASFSEASVDAPPGAEPAERPDAVGVPTAASLAAELARVREEKQTVLEGIRAIEADFRAGVLAEVDYIELRRQEEDRALALIARADELAAALGPAGLGPAATGPAGPAPAMPAPEEVGTAASTRPAPAVAEATGAARPAAEAPRTAAAAAGRRAEAGAPWMRAPVLAGVAALLLVGGVGLGYLVAVQTGSDPMASAGTAGGDPALAAGMPGPVAARVREYRARLEKDPRDLEALLGMAGLNLERQDLRQAIDYYKRALDVDPGNPEALTRFGLILGQAGHLPEALSALDRALVRDPNYIEALWLKGEVELYGLRDFAAATATWQRVVTLLPEGPDRARAVAALAEARAGGAGGATGGSQPAGAGQSSASGRPAGTGNPPAAGEPAGPAAPGTPAREAPAGLAREAPAAAPR